MTKVFANQQAPKANRGDASVADQDEVYDRARRSTRGLLDSFARGAAVIAGVAAAVEEMRNPPAPDPANDRQTKRSVHRRQIHDAAFALAQAETDKRPTDPEVAEKAGRSPRTLREWRSKGDIPPAR